MTFFFRFEKILIMDRLAIKFFFDISTDLITNIVKFSKNLSSSIKKYINLVCLSKPFTYAPPFGSIICNGLSL